MPTRFRKLAVTALLLAVVPAAQAQFSDLLRSLSGALRGGGGGQPQQQQLGQTATIGIRGMDEGGTVAQAPAGEDNALLDGWQSTRDEAQHLAASRGLTARTVRLKSEPAPADTTNN